MFEINSLPYLVDNWNEVEAVYLDHDSAFNTLFADTLEGLGLHFMANAPEGFIDVVAEKIPENATTTGDKDINTRV